MSRAPTGRVTPSCSSTATAIRWARGTPRRWIPTSTSPSVPACFSTSSWEMRMTARRISSAVMIWRPSIRRARDVTRTSSFPASPDRSLKGRHKDTAPAGAGRGQRDAGPRADRQRATTSSSVPGSGAPWRLPAPSFDHAYTLMVLPCPFWPGGLAQASRSLPSDRPGSAAMSASSVSPTLPSAFTAKRLSRPADWSVAPAIQTARCRPDGSQRTSQLVTPASPAVWRPVVDPTNRSVVFWTGTQALDPATNTWIPTNGRLVTDDWQALVGPGDVTAIPLPGSAGLAGVTSWDARWDPSGRHLAVWIAGATDQSAGRLSLFAVNADGSVGDTLLADIAALPGLSLGSDRLAWASPPGQNGQGKHHERVCVVEGWCREPPRRPGSGDRRARRRSLTVRLSFARGPASR